MWNLSNCLLLILALSVSACMVREERIPAPSDEVVYVLVLQHTCAQDLAEVLPAHLDFPSPPRIEAQASSNSLVLFGRPEQLEKVRFLVCQLDQPSRNDS
jgi:type II secretory pathway component GspD/PulD (secretin)